ncbi:MAG: hypothetical protein V3T05_06705 [Myxococcota bacterium]
MQPAEKLFETFRDWLAVTNPGLVTREDLANIEQRLDELHGLLDEIEERLQPDDDDDDALS